MKCKRLYEFLDTNKIEYKQIHHPVSFSAQMTAHVAHIPGRELAKTVIIKVDGKLTMVVVNANQKVNLVMLRELFDTSDIEIARETDFMEKFPDCELGAMPPFGNLYGIDEIVSNDLSRDYEIAFNAGTHSDLIRMKYSDFEMLVKPKLFDFSKRKF